MSNIVNQDTTEILLVMHRIEDRLQEMVQILRISHKENVDSIQKKVLSGSPLRKGIYNLCDGKHSVGQIATKLDRAIQQVSNNITLLQSAGLIREVRKGKQKCYTRVK